MSWGQPQKPRDAVRERLASELVVARNEIALLQSCCGEVLTELAEVSKTWRLLADECADAGPLSADRVAWLSIMFGAAAEHCDTVRAGATKILTAGVQ